MGAPIIPETITYRGWAKGMDNIHAAFELPEDTLRNAVNVDVLDSGKIRRRRGYTEIAPGRAHSLWTDGSIALLYFAGDLCRLNDDYSTTVLVADVADRPISFTPAGLDIYWSNGFNYGRISNGVARPWGVEDVAAPPALTALTGAMTPGRYQAACTFITVAGEESAASRFAEIVSAGGILISPPQPTTPEVVAVRLYLTEPDGDIFYKVRDVALGATVALQSNPNLGQALRTGFMRRFLPCDEIATYRGRIYGSTGNILWHTQPFAFGLYRPAQDFILFPKPITMHAAVEEGIYVAAEKTYFLSGAHEDFAPREILPFGAARGSVSRLPDNQGVLWFSDRGLVSGSNGGVVKQLQVQNVHTGAYAAGATVVREQNSVKQMLGIVRSPDAASNLAAQDWMEAEIIRAAEVADG